MTLLHDVRQLMGQKLLTRHRIRLITTRGKDDVTYDRIGRCVQITGRFCREVIVMDAHMPEIMPEARFEKAACRAIERPTR